MNNSKRVWPLLSWEVQSPYAHPRRSTTVKEEDGDGDEDATVCDNNVGHVE